MPGPRSAPNGQRSLTERRHNQGDGDRTVKTGKTALKKGLIKSAKKQTEENRIRQGMVKAKQAADN